MFEEKSTTENVWISHVRPSYRYSPFPLKPHPQSTLHSGKGLNSPSSEDQNAPSDGKLSPTFSESSKCSEDVPKLSGRKEMFSDDQISSSKFQNNEQKSHLVDRANEQSLNTDENLKWVSRNMEAISMIKNLVSSSTMSENMNSEVAEESRNSKSQSSKDEESDDIRFSCEHCKKQFSDPSILQRHIRIRHLGARSHPCPECGKTFGTSSGLKQHQHIHSSVKPFTCEVCHKSYTQFSNLCRHKRMHADCRTQIKCKNCQQVFANASSLNKHRRFCDNKSYYSDRNSMDIFAAAQKFTMNNTYEKKSHPHFEAQPSSEAIKRADLPQGMMAQNFGGIPFSEEFSSSWGKSIHPYTMRSPAFPQISENNLGLLGMFSHYPQMYKSLTDTFSTYYPPKTTDSPLFSNKVQKPTIAHAQIQCCNPSTDNLSGISDHPRSAFPYTISAKASNFVQCQESRVKNGGSEIGIQVDLSNSKNDRQQRRSTLNIKDSNDCDVNMIPQSTSSSENCSPFSTNSSLHPKEPSFNKNEGFQLNQQSVPANHFSTLFPFSQYLPSFSTNSVPVGCENNKNMSQNVAQLGDFKFAAAPTIEIPNSESSKESKKIWSPISLSCETPSSESRMSFSSVSSSNKSLPSLSVTPQFCGISPNFKFDSLAISPYTFTLAARTYMKNLASQQRMSETAQQEVPSASCNNQKATANLQKEVKNSLSTPLDLSVPKPTSPEARSDSEEKSHSRAEVPMQPQVSSSNFFNLPSSTSPLCRSVDSSTYLMPTFFPWSIPDNAALSYLNMLGQTYRSFPFSNVPWPSPLPEFSNAKNYFGKYPFSSLLRTTETQPVKKEDNEITKGSSYFAPDGRRLSNEKVENVINNTVNRDTDLVTDGGCDASSGKNLLQSWKRPADSTVPGFQPKVQKFPSTFIAPRSMGLRPALPNSMYQRLSGVSSARPNKDRYTCKFCGKLFPRSANLTRHVRTHTGEQPYSCKYCERSFSISSNLQRHVRNIHKKERPYICHRCGRQFGQQANLERHLRKPCDKRTKHTDWACSNKLSANEEISDEGATFSPKSFASADTDDCFMKAHDDEKQNLSRKSSLYSNDDEDRLGPSSSDHNPFLWSQRPGFASVGPHQGSVSNAINFSLNNRSGFFSGPEKRPSIEGSEGPQPCFRHDQGLGDFPNSVSPAPLTNSVSMKA